MLLAARASYSRLSGLPAVKPKKTEKDDAFEGMLMWSPELVLIAGLRGRIWGISLPVAHWQWESSAFN